MNDPRTKIWAAAPLAVGDASLDWWRQAIAGAPRIALLPDHTVAAGQTLATSDWIALPPDLAAMLTGGIGSSDASPDPMLPLAAAALAILLQRYSGEDDVLLACEAPFASIAALRLDLSDGPAGETLVARAQIALQAAWPQLMPSHRLDDLGDTGKQAWDALSPPCIAVQWKTAELTTGPPAAWQGPLRFELQLCAGGQAQLGCVWRAGLYQSETVRHWLSSWALTLDQLVRQPQSPVAAIDVLTAAQRRLLVTLNDTARDDTGPLAIRLIEAQARAAPGRVALVCRGQETTYGELADAADQLAASLVTRGVGRGIRVGLLLPRGPDLIIAVLAVLKAGAAYVPLDPAFPSGRLGYMLQDSGAALVITHSSLASRLAGAPPARLLLDRDAWQGSAGTPGTTIPLEPGDAAYVIYTSGSTGLPKGVEIPHRALTNLLLSLRAEPGLAAADTMLLANTLAFDISVVEIYLPLLVGARMVIAAADEAGDGAALAGLIDRHGVTVVQAGPTRLQLMLDAGWRPAPGVRILTGGETVTRSLTGQLTPAAEIWNMYGPTETTVWSTRHRVTPGTGPVPIGRPISNTQVYVLDRTGGLAPLGAVGELGIAGHGVASGYVNRPELTAQCFLPNPFGPGRLYRTGDRVRWQWDGTLDYLSRMDHQVKLRGFRIEPGEVEAALLRHPQLRHAVVLPGQLGAGEQALIAYVVPADPAAWPTIERQLPGLLAEWLPHYMVPQAIMMLPALPLLVNGKIDRSRLPQPSPSAPIRSAGPDGMGRLLGAIWQKVLKLPSIDPAGDFFDLGGDSILAMALMVEIMRQTGHQLPAHAIYEAPTPAAMAALLSAGVPARRSSSLVRLKPGDGTPLFIAPGIGGSVMELRGFARRLDAGGPVYGLQARGLDGAAAPLHQVEDMAALYLAEIRELQPRGPYRLAGFSFGGLVALEMAQRLRRAGETVAFLSLLDSYPFTGFWPLRCKAAAWRLLAGALLSPGAWRRVYRTSAGQVRGQPSSIASRLRKAALLPFSPLLLVWLLQRFVWLESPVPDDPAVQRVKQAGKKAFAAYRPGHYAGELIFVKAVSKTNLPLEALWQRLARQLIIYQVQATHFELVRGGAARLAEALSTALRRIDDGAPAALADGLPRERLGLEMPAPDFAEHGHQRSP